MKYIYTSFFAAFFVSILLLNPVMAGSEVIPDFDVIDTNKDGKVSRDEASQVPQIANLFQGADLDQDSELDPNEYDRVKKHLEKKS